MITDQEEFGTLVLVLGDMHVPDRVPEISDKIKELIPPGKFASLLSTGNFGSIQSYNWAKSICNNLIGVKGDCQANEVPGLTQEKVVEMKGRRIGLIHGHQIIPCGVQEPLLEKAIEMNVSLLISGHTHELRISECDGITFINPGSLTGSYSPLRSDVVNSFVILEMKKRSIIVHGYEYVDGQLRAGRYVIEDMKQ